MSAAEPAAGRPRVVGFRAAQTRIIDAALELFAVHGVGGTSLQMIADAIGVTKAAVYHQFRTKDEVRSRSCSPSSSTSPSTTVTW